MAMVVCMMPTAVFAADETPVAPASKTDLEKATITLSAASAVYNGKDQEPMVTVTGAVKDTDFEVKWAKGDLKKADEFTDEVTVTELKDAGKYSVLIKATDNGKLENSTVRNFTISEYNLDKADIRIKNQTTIPSSNGEGKADAPFNELQKDTINFYYGGEKITAEAAKVFTEKITVTLTKNTDNNYTASFALKNEADKKNFSGTLSATSFSIVGDISDAQMRKPDGKTVITDKSITSDQPYDGKVKAVASMFTLYKGDKQLYLNRDYTVTCAEATKAGVHDVKIEGMGAYGGSIDAKLTIGQRNANIYVNPDSIPDQTMKDVNNVEPVLRDRELGILKKGEDYNIDSRSGEPGTNGTVVVSFKGNYTGNTMSIPFKIVADDKNIDGKGIAVSYNGKDYSNGGLIVTGGMYNGASQPLYGISVYTFDGIKKTDLSSTYYTINYEYTDTKGKVVSTTAPVDAKRYSVYLVGRNGYAGKRLLGTYTIQKYNMSYVDVNVYMANAVATPTVTVKSKYENITFTKDKDFTFTHWVNTSKGTVTVSVTAVVDGNLTGSTSVTSPITAKSITSCSAGFVNNRNSAIYTGYAITPDVIVRDGYTTLTKGTHYKVVYKNAAGKTVSAIKDAGTYTVEIQGMGAYVGTLTLYFTVTGNDISNYTVTLKENSVNATGMIQIPRIDSVKSGNKVLATSNYTVSYQDATGKTVSIIKDPGTYKVVVTGKGAYSGSTYATYRVVGLTQTITTGKDSYKAYPTTDDFDLNAKSDYALSKLTYTSSNPAVASVSANGTVTINKVGRAVITINASQVGKYEAASKSVIIKVYPKKTVITRSLWTGGNAKQFKVRWNYQDGATKYQIRYSRYSDFNKYSTKNVASRGNNNYATQTNTVKKLRSNTKYFVKVRAIYVDEESGAVYYGRWSSVRSIKTK